MSRVLTVEKAGPGVSVQDMGRPGFLTFGLSRGGAADRLAIREGAALLGQGDGAAVIEMAGAGGVFVASEPMRIALTGAPMRVTLDGARLAWNASHLLPAGVPLTIGAVERGSYGYLSVGGGIETPERLGARGTHFVAGLGSALEAGAELPIGADKGTRVGYRLKPSDRFGGGRARIVPSLQTDLFEAAERARFEATEFRRDARANRMGVRLLSEGEGFHTNIGLSILSEVIVPGDIQVTGDGTPFILLVECGTTGGYPRIGSVIPSDLPLVSQAPLGSALRLSFVPLDEAVEIERREAAARATYLKSAEPLVRDPHDMPDLLAYNLVGGVVDATDG